MDRYRSFDSNNNVNNNSNQGVKRFRNVELASPSVSNSNVPSRSPLRFVIDKSTNQEKISVPQRKSFVVEKEVRRKRKRKK